MSFQVTTENRLAARKLLTTCGVKPEMARSMALRQLQEHLENFVALGTIGQGIVSTALNTGRTAETATDVNWQQMGEAVIQAHTDFINASAERNKHRAQSKTPNAGAPWGKHQDEELRAHFERGMSIDSMASIRGRTTGGIKARLQHLGLMRYNPRTNEYEEVKQPEASDQGNDVTKPGEFATAEQAAEVMKEMIDGAKAAMAMEVKIEDVTVDTKIIAAMIANALRPVEKHCSQLQSNYAELMQVIADTIAIEVKKSQDAWQKFEITTGDKIHKIEGLAHKAFPKLLRAVSARTRHDKAALNIWLYGPAGTGKSTAARKLAEAFSLAFHTNGPVGSQWDIRGFTDAQGKIVETAFRRAWINGGVYCWDEGDGSAPAALIEANGALATGFASFPDGVFQRHADCIVIINGNLRPGAAPDATYNGRYKQDTAFVNRFIAIEWGIDEDLERALLGKLDKVGDDWLKFVRKLRVQINKRNIKGIVISPRQLQYGLALLDAGAPIDDVMDQTVRFMFTEDQWKQVVE